MRYRRDNITNRPKAHGPRPVGLKLVQFVTSNMAHGESTMKIRFRQSGGVAGLAKVAEVDSGQIPHVEAGRLRALVDDALSQSIPEAGPAMPDEEQYCVEIEIAERRQTILVARSSVPGPVRPLIEYLEKLAEYEKR